MADQEGTGRAGRRWGVHREFGSRRARRWLGSAGLALIAGILPLARVASAAADPATLGPYLEWSSPSANDTYSAVTQRITPRRLAPTMYLATQWFWNGAVDGGYAGIQIDGVRADGSMGPMANFSIWDATKAVPGRHSACVPFGGEGVGMSCRAPFRVVANDTYRTDVRATRTDAAGQWWHATITDETTGAVADLGSIAAPAGVGMHMPTNFIEDFGRAGTCDQYPIVIGDFQAPIVTPLGSTTALPSAFQEAPPRVCAPARISSIGATTSVTFGGPEPAYVPNVTARISHRSVKVAWPSAISDGGSPITGYVVEASGDAGNTWQVVTDASANARTASVAAPGTGTYTFRVAAVNAAGTGAWSDPTVPLAIP